MTRPDIRQTLGANETVTEIGSGIESAIVNAIEIIERETAVMTSMTATMTGSRLIEILVIYEIRGSRVTIETGSIETLETYEIHEICATHEIHAIPETTVTETVGNHGPTDVRSPDPTVDPIVGQSEGLLRRRFQRRR